MSRTIDFRALKWLLTSPMFHGVGLEAAGLAANWSIGRLQAYRETSRAIGHHQLSLRTMKTAIVTKCHLLTCRMSTLAECRKVLPSTSTTLSKLCLGQRKQRPFHIARLVHQIIAGQKSSCCPLTTNNKQARSFADTADDALLSYLESRSVSRGFLVEIDQLLRSHPEIADCHEGQQMITEINSRPPLEAYKWFLKGYTRPAR